MAKSAYIGNTNAHKVKKIYLGSSNAAKVKKGYVGDANGTAKPFFSSGFVWKKYKCVETLQYTYDKYNIVTKNIYGYETVQHNPPGRMNTAQRRWYTVPRSNYSGLNTDTGTWETGRQTSIVSSSNIGWIGQTANPSTIYDAEGATKQPSGGYLFLYYISRHSVIESTQQMQGSFIETVTFPTKKYSSNGAQDGYWWIFTGQTIEYSQGEYVSDVESDNATAYPENGRHTDGFWYVKVPE